MPTPLPAPRRLAAPVALAVLALVLGALALLRPAPAHASATQISIMVDDNNLVYRGNRVRDSTLATMKSLGVDYVRVTLLWNAVAATAIPYDRAHHRRFNPANPASYAPHAWDPYDTLVRSASRLGIGVYFDITGPGPDFAHASAPSSLRADVRPTWMPNAQQFYKFVTAVGIRYSGRFKLRRGVTIPRVSVWSLWNEPNQGGWITPQYYKVGGQLIPYSPVIYRKLFFLGRTALQNTGHGRDSIFIGETAPIGVARRNATSAMDPKTFIRELFCVDPSGHPYTGAAAAARDCQLFNKNPVFYATAWAHHPYTKFLAPAVRDRNPNDITLANINDLSTLLDQLAATTHRIKSGLPIVSTEFGYETKPPDPFFGVPLATQAQWINEGDFLTFQNPRIVANTQFLLYDVPPVSSAPRGSRAYWSTYQSGLLFANRTAKPSLASYQLPVDTFAGALDPFTGKPTLGLWGQLRFLNHAGVPGTVPIYAQPEFRAQGSASYVPLGTRVLVSDHYLRFFYTIFDDPGPGLLRVHWSGYPTVRLPDHYSRAIPIS